MRRAMIIIMTVVLGTACNLQSGCKTKRQGFPIDWNIQDNVLEQRHALDEATGRENHYEGTDAQLAK